MQRQRTRRSPVLTFGIFGLAAIVVIGIVLYTWLGWNIYWLWLVAVNIVTFLFFRLDKRRAAAERGQTRIPEIVLLALLLGGGVLGGAAGMLLRPRHKVRKPMFWGALVAGTLLHGVFVWQWLF